MGSRLDLTDTGVALEIHVFDDRAAAEQYLKTGRAFRFDRHEPWAFSPGIDFYQGPSPDERASLRQKAGGYWQVAFWNQGARP